MRQLKRFKTSVPGIAVGTALAAMIALSIGTAAAQPSPSPSPTPSPSLQGATTVTIDNTDRDCSGTAHFSVKGSGAGSGFAVITVAGPTGPNGPGRTLIANVDLANAAPNSNYGVRLIQIFTPPSNRDCGFSSDNPYDATLQTDAWGNGSVNIQEAVLPGADHAFVVLNNTTTAAATDFYTSPDVPFTTGRNP